MAMNKTELFALISQNIPDNTTGAIKPEHVRSTMTQIADSMAYQGASAEIVEVLRSQSTLSQSPTELGSPIQVSLGNSQGSASSDVSLTSAGVATFNSPGDYLVSISMTAARTVEAGDDEEVPGKSVIMARAMTGSSQIGSPLVVNLYGLDDLRQVFTQFAMTATEGQTLSFQLMRDASGDNSGGIVSTPSSVQAWGASPSAQIVISKVVVAS